LVVDDDSGVRSFLRQLLTELGHGVQEAGHGQEALSRAREQRPDAIICDGLMPVMDGFQLLQALKRDPGLSSIPFIFLSSVYTGEREQHLARDLGADAFLVKPQPPEAIVRALQAATSDRVPIAHTVSAPPGDAELAREYSRVVATALEEKVGQLERVTRDLERTKKELQESEAVYRGLFENNPQPMWVFEVETLDFLAVNDAAIITYGFSREEFLAMTIKDIRRPEDVQKLIKRVSTVADGFDAAGTWKHRKKAGTIIDVEITSHSLVFSGRRAKLVLANDVTQRMRIEKAIRHASDEWRATFDAMTEGVALLDADGRIMRCNRAMAVLMKKPFSEIVGQACAEMCACFGGSREGCPFIKSKKTLKREAVVFKQGEQWFEASADPIVDEAGTVQGAVHILQEITERKRLEDELRDSGEKFKNFFEFANDAVFILDMTGKFIDVNRTGYERLGYSKEEMLAKHVSEFDSPEFVAKVPERIAQIAKYGQAVFESAHVKKDGVVMPVEINARIIDFEGRKALLSVVRDITERRKAEESLREQQQFTENLIMNSAIATFVLDASHKVLIWNKACEELTGIPAAAIIGTKDHWKAFYEHERPILADIVLGQESEKLSLFYESCSQSTLTQDGIHAEAWFKNLNNKDRYIVFDAAPIRDASGAIIAAIETLQDFTDSKTLEEQIHQAKQDWEYTFNSITDMVTVHDKDYNIIQANKAAEKILKLPIMEKLKDQKCFSYYHGTDQAPAGCPSCGCLQSGVPAVFEIFEPHLNMFIEIRAIPRFDSNGKMIGLIHVVRDITERKHLEQQVKAHNEQLEMLVFERTRALEDTNKELVLRREEADAASRSKTDFLANMSHELRTPLNAIMGFSEIMFMGMAGPVSDKQREFLGDISKSGNHLLSLINDILDLSKVEAGKLELEQEMVIVGELISGSQMMFKEKALKHAIRMETFIDPAVPQIVADRRKLKQVLVNLLSNAFKFTPDGGSVRVTTRLIRNAEFGIQNKDEKPIPQSAFGIPHLEFSVADTGYGIEPEHLPLLFQPFQQIDSSLTRKHAGSGLGLSLCRRFVELHGGRIWVESEPGKGSTFRFVIPVGQKGNQSS